VRFELLRAAREEDDVRAFLRKRLRARQPEPGRGAADERGPPAQSEIHGATLSAEAALAVDQTGSGTSAVSAIGSSTAA